MTSAAHAFDLEGDAFDLTGDDFDPPSGTRLSASAVVSERADTIDNALLEACGERASVSRLLSLHPVPRLRLL